jgi:hypothetical protein
MANPKNPKLVPVAQDDPGESNNPAPPRDMHPTSDIRFVMTEVAALKERVDGLIKSVEKIGPAFEKSADRQSADFKERIAEVKIDLKEGTVKLSEVKTSIDSFKGAMKVFGGIYAFALVVTAAFLAWYLRPIPQTILQSSAVQQQDAGTKPSESTKNSN